MRFNRKSKDNSASTECPTVKGMGREGEGEEEAEKRERE